MGSISIRKEAGSGEGWQMIETSLVHNC
jgi:hypothetical protein